MKSLSIIASILIIFASCKCDDCIVRPPYVQFYMASSDTILHPLNKNDSLKIYSYYLRAKWNTVFIYDSFRYVKLNWFSMELDTNFQGKELSFVLDQKLTPNHIATDLGVYDFWLKGKEKDFQIKLSNMKINSTGTSGRCACPNYELEKCTINDSIAYNRPFRLW